MKKILVLLLLAFGVWHWYTQKPPGFTGEAHERVIMYSLTTCGYCDQKRSALLEARIRFVEYYIDQDPARREELHQKLQKAGFTIERYGTPTFDVHGYMLPNNPTMEKIRERMAPGKKVS
jgi:glutaredoxin